MIYVSVMTRFAFFSSLASKIPSSGQHMWRKTFIDSLTSSQHAGGYIGTGCPQVSPASIVDLRYLLQLVWVGTNLWHYNYFFALARRISDPVLIRNPAGINYYTYMLINRSSVLDGWVQIKYCSACARNRMNILYIHMLYVLYVIQTSENLRIC